MTGINMVRMIPKTVRVESQKEDNAMQGVSFLEMLKEKQLNSDSQKADKTELEKQEDSQKETKPEENSGQKTPDAAGTGAVETQIAAAVSLQANTACAVVEMMAFEAGTQSTEPVVTEPQMISDVGEEPEMVMEKQVNAGQEQTGNQEKTVSGEMELPETPVMKNTAPGENGMEAPKESNAAQTQENVTPLPGQEVLTGQTDKAGQESVEAKTETVLLKKEPAKTVGTGGGMSETSDETSVADQASAVHKLAGQEISHARKTDMAHEPVRTSQAELPTDVAKAIAARMPSDNGTLTIELEPASLGKVTIQVVYESGRTSLSLLATNPKTLELLSRSAAEIAGILENKTGQETVIYTSEPQQEFADAREGGREGRREPGDQQEERRKEQPDSFLQQLRLGLV